MADEVFACRSEKCHSKLRQISDKENLLRAVQRSQKFVPHSDELERRVTREEDAAAALEIGKADDVDAVPQNGDVRARIVFSFQRFHEGKQIGEVDDRSVCGAIEPIGGADRLEKPEAEEKW